MIRPASMFVALALASAASGCAEAGEPAADADATMDTALEQPAQETQLARRTTLSVDSLDGAPYLADADGRALYLLEGEPADSSTCYDGCAEAWPAFMAPEEAPEAGSPSVRSDLIGTIERRDGGTQVTYGGHPLYYYSGDTGAGQTSGQDVTDQWGEWYLVRPSGKPLEQH